MQTKCRYKIQVALSCLHSLSQSLSLFSYRLVGVVTLLSVREVEGSIAGSVKSDAVSPTARHRCDVSFELCCRSVKPRRLAPSLVTRFDYEF